jgi:drug/metabolite transporter (DMT)-like permease
VGGFLLLGGNGGVVWAEQHVPSGLTALLVATVPLWMALLEWMRGEAGRPAGRTSLGLVLGLLGVGLLVSARSVAGTRHVDPAGTLVLGLASISWAWGSLWGRRADMPRSPLLSTAMQMLLGGLLLLLAGLLGGEAARVDLAVVSTRSVLALGYLFAFGSFVGFTAYVYLLRATTPTRATTYAFVNPLVAVLLGWALAGEPVSPRVIGAAGCIVLAVFLIVMSPRRGSAAAPAPAESCAGD